MSPKWTLLRTRLDVVAEQRDRARRSLRLWRGVFWSVGVATVAVAAVAGAGGLADLFGARVAGLLALGAAVLAATEKYLGAGDKVGALARRYNDLNDLACRLEGELADARQRESDHGLGRGDYDTWLRNAGQHVDKELHAINIRGGEI